MSANKRIEYISLASVISAIAVVFLHVNDCFWSFSKAPYWFSANVIESLFFFAVPVFFMISGALLIDFSDKYDLKTYFSKRINKTVLPFVIWSFIGVLFKLLYLHTLKWGAVTPAYLINGLVNGNLVGVYWFFIPLFCAYLAIPLFSFVSAEKKKMIFIYLASLAFVLNILIPFVISVFDLKINYSISLAVARGYLFFTITGYLLHKYELERKYRLILYILAIVGLLMQMIGTYQLSIAAEKIVSTYKGYTNLPAVLYSMGVFVFIKYDLVKIMKFDIVSKAVNFLNPYTFGVYLIHWFVLSVLIKIFNINIKLLSYRLIGPIVIFVISIVVIWLIRKVPGVTKIVP